MVDNTRLYFEQKFSGAAVIAYDGDCPMCRNFVRLVRLRDVCPDIVMFNLRDLNQEDRRMIGRDYNLDQGMLFVFDGQIHYGDAALHRMALLSTNSTIFNRINKFVFRHRRLSATLYPALAGGRLILLKMLGRTTIH